MKTAKILTSALALSHLGLTTSQEKHYNLKDNLSKNVLKDTQAIREIREYKSHTQKQKTEYDKKVEKIADCFAEIHPIPEQWNETKAILDIHECSLKNDYPNIQPLDQIWENKVKRSRQIPQIQTDFTQASEPFKNHIFKIADKDLTTKISDTEVKLKVSDLPFIYGNPVIEIDNKQVAQIILSQDEKNNFVLYMTRSNIVQTEYSKNQNSDSLGHVKYYKYLLNSTDTLTKHINNSANKLLSGQFNNQKEAIDGLIDYKILSSIPFSIEDQRGTQFKNIVKMNYLTEALKEKYPEKIDGNLHIPHLVEREEFKNDLFLKNPEIAVLALTPNLFKATQKKQIQQELTKVSKGINQEL